MGQTPLIVFDRKGIYCPRAEVYIDPWEPVHKAIVTHAHADHARWGSDYYLAHTDSAAVLRHRLGDEINLETKGYHEPVHINGVEISLHPAGHIIGSAQVRLAYKGEIWVVSGDYKTEPDPTCTPFEPVRCHHFITESTFGLPVYKWRSNAFEEMNKWWKENKEKGLTSVILGYSLGKAQRIIANLNEQIGTVYTHGAIENTNRVLRQAGIEVKPTVRVTAELGKVDFLGNMVVAPPSALSSSWMKRFHPYSVGIASGWMALRGTRRRRNVDRGFVVSDHADWVGLNAAVRATDAEKIYVTHGYTDIFANWLKSQGMEAEVVQTEYEGELSEIGEAQLPEKEEDGAVQ